MLDMQQTFRDMVIADLDRYAALYEGKTDVSYEISSEFARTDKGGTGCLSC
jgi:hypothetical protein